jgi:hypothetical protein
MISKTSSCRLPACVLVCWAAGLVLSWAGAASAEARPPRAERVADRIAERRYARLSIAEARVAEAESRAARAEARVAQIAPVVPTPPPPRPATVRRMARAGVPLGRPMPPPPVVAAQPPVPLQPAVSRAAAADGAWTLAAEDAVSPATAEVAPEGTRSVLAAGGSPGEPASAPAPARSGPAVTQPPVELLPTPEAKK